MNKKALSIILAALYLATGCGAQERQERPESEAPARPMEKTESAQARYEELMRAGSRSMRLSGRYHDAFKGLHEAMKERRERLTTLGEAFVGDFPDAPQTPKVRHQLCVWHQGLGNPKKILAVADNFYREHPGHERTDAVRLLQSWALIETGREEEGLGILERMAGPESDERHRWRAQFQLGKYRMGREEFDRARAVFREAKKTAPLPLVPAIDRELARLEELGKPPTPFTVTGKNGEKLSPKQFKGKVLLIDFWNTHHGPYMPELMLIRETYRKFHDDGFEILGINMDKNPQNFKNMLIKENINWPQFYDGKTNEIAELYGIDQNGSEYLPRTYLVDRAGNVRRVSLPGAALDKIVEKLLDEKMPE